MLTEGLERAFARFGGVPKELLFDQMRAVVLSEPRGRRRAGVERGVSARCRALPPGCRPYRAQTKGKVERPIRYIRDSFFYARVRERRLNGGVTLAGHGRAPDGPLERDERRSVGTPSLQRFGVHARHRQVPRT